ncbi:MAG: ParB/RepB/Spo0J family partition protein [Butyricicoccus pullicaecorum]|nr:ParB/RepB/Spo0J family partition protein [Butyricicoccus pullicaecorum]
MAKRNTDFILPPLDDLFSSQEEREDAKLERVQIIPLDQLHPFKDHPFKIQDDEEMERMIESVKTLGAITPALARPLPDGGYEVVSGHRRLAACQAAGLSTMPVIVRNLTDDEAVIAMVDANLQREHILPIEKAFAYKMKLEAIKYQGATSPQLGEKLLSAERVGQDSGDSKNQVLRYVRLTHLIPELLGMVDIGRIAFTPAVELSFLLPEEQKLLLTEMEYGDCTPNLSQAQRLKSLSTEGKLTAEAVAEIMGEEKANQKERIKIPADRVRKFFPKSYTVAQMEEEIVKMCETRYRKRRRELER